MRHVCREPKPRHRARHHERGPHHPRSHTPLPPLKSLDLRAPAPLPRPWRRRPAPPPETPQLLPERRSRRDARSHPGAAHHPHPERMGCWRGDHPRPPHQRTPHAAVRDQNLAHPEARGRRRPATQKRPRTSLQRFEAAQPHETWQADFPTGTSPTAATSRSSPGSITTPGRSCPAPPTHASRPPS